VGDVGVDGEELAEEIILRACEVFKIPREELLGWTRSRYLIRRRHALFYVLRTLTGLSYPEIGQVVDFDHTTVLYAYKKVRREMEAGGRSAVQARKLLAAFNAEPESVEFF
jgi:chromosomal replication initiation ATPase DnaA